MSAHCDRAHFANVTLLEFSTTRDRVVELKDGGWAICPSTPQGPGWHVHDAHRERYTVWVRWRMLP